MARRSDAAATRTSSSAVGSSVADTAENDSVCGWSIDGCHDPACETLSVENVAFASAAARGKPSPWTWRMFKLYLCLLIATTNSCINGYDGSLMAAINSYPQYRSYFHFDPVKGTPETGIVYAIYQIGNLAGSFAAGPATDAYGRKWGMFSGALLIVLGTVVQATSSSVAAFMGGRFVLGFGVSVCASAGPAYVSEMAHPVYRGPLTGLYNAFWYVGALPGSFVPYGTSELQGSAAWRVPTWLQLVFASVVLLGSPFLPETPRWLIANDRHEEALSVMAAYHGEGDRESPIVQLEYREMVEDISVTGADKRWWDYRELFNSHEVRYRTFIVVTFAFFSQWVGNGPVSYYYPLILQSAGITNNHTRLLLNGCQVLVSLSGALLGASMTDRWGRRKQLLSSTFAIMLIFAGILALHATNPPLVDSTTKQPLLHADGTPKTLRPGHSRAVIVLIFAFGLVYSAGWTPLQALYPVECLRYESRAKGMGLYNALVNVANFYNTFATGVAVTRLGWRYYVVFVAWDALVLAVVWAFYVETKRRTLEELAEIFRAPSPRKASLGRVRVVVVRREDGGGGVDVVEGMGGKGGEACAGSEVAGSEARWSW